MPSRPPPCSVWNPARNAPGPDDRAAAARSPGGSPRLERRSSTRGAHRRRVLSPRVVEARHRYLTAALGGGEAEQAAEAAPRAVRAVGADHADMGTRAERGADGDVDQAALDRRGHTERGERVAVAGNVGRSRPEPGGPLVVEERAGDQQGPDLPAAERGQGGGRALDGAV